MTTKHSDPRVATLAGAIAGGVEATITWPTEFVKTQLQLQGKAGQAILYDGPVDCVKKTVRSNGFLGLYRGLPALLIGSVPKAGIRFGAFGFFSSKLKDSNGKMSAGKNFMAGVGAGVIEAFVIVTPMETLKVRLINANKGLIPGTMEIIAKEGIGGIYKGLPATIGRQASNQGIRFLTFGESKKAILARTGDAQLHPGYALCCGMFAGICSVLGNNPIDVVKTRTQGLEADKYKGAIDCAQKILKHEGPAAFYKGALSRMARVVPGQGIVFGSFESIQRVIAKGMGLPDK